MGQQISHAGDQNLDAVHEHKATTSVAEIDYSSLTCRVEKLVKLAQSSLANRIHSRYLPAHNTDVRQHLLQEDSSVISAPATAAHDTLSLQFADISAIDLSFDEDEYEMGVAAVIRESVGLYCHVPVRKVCKADSCNIGCQSVDESDHNAVKANTSFEHLFAETSNTACADVTCIVPIPTDSKLIVNEHVSETSASGGTFLSMCEPRMDGRIGLNDTKCHCKSRPPRSPKLITTPETVLHLAHETRPPEIGSSLTVIPATSSSDLGLSPIDETTEVVTTPGFLYDTTDGTSNQATSGLANHTLDDFFPASDYTLYIPHKMEVDVPDVENSAASSSSHCDASYVHTPLRAKRTFSQLNTGFESADTKHLSKNESRQPHTCFACCVSQPNVPDIIYGGCRLGMSDSNPVWTEWETALPCCDWSANNNESSNPITAQKNVSPTAGPMIARRQVRHSSDSSAPLSSSLPSTGEHRQNSSNQNLSLPDRSLSQLSLDEIIVSPRNVPERLDFLQLEKFEGRYSVRHKFYDIYKIIILLSFSYLLTYFYY